MVQAGHVKLVEQLLPLIDKSRASVARDSDNQVIYRDYWYVEPMFSALRTDNVVEILSLLKKFGADFNHIGGKGSLLINAIYLLLDGFEKEKLKVIYFLIRNGADLSVIDGRNNSIIDILEQNVGECPSAFKDEYNKLLDFVRSSIECETPLVVSEDKQETTSDSHNKKVMSELMRQRAKLYKPTEFLNVFSHKEEVINDISFHNSLNA
ncbi:MAG: hypothetical protein HWD59_07705 [Coxiellaceae bacterium]|nr:MAG: hypothetical protein HWD59_07705 [Coxiellaceae bacterium]